MLNLGIDVGSTTVKTVVTDPEHGRVLFSKYVRHNARQRETLMSLLVEIGELFPGESFHAAVCGSGGKHIAEALGVHYIQEVVANAAAVRHLYPQVRTAIELGGQDAKVIFFHKDEQTGKIAASDMRMNGSCAGGTGAFIDEVAKLLSVPTENFDSLASAGNMEYEISGRCGVFAKTDIQPLLIAGAKKEDIALSTFHAIVKQTIGGLAQGLELSAPIIFEGGPLTFQPTLIRVFAERLGLGEGDIVVPEHPETIVAYGTTIALEELFPLSSDSDVMTAESMKEKLQNSDAHSAGSEQQPKFFANQEEKSAFDRRHDGELGQIRKITEGGCILPVYIGIDSGSTTSKIVFVDEDDNVVDRFYANNNGEPLKVVKRGLCELKDKYDEMGFELKILGLGTTGYGEKMMAKAFGADYHTVETVAHSKSCTHYYPDTTFLLDIGGQDMKAIWLNNGIITNIMLNEACSSGCGSFLENFADNLQIPVEEIAENAFNSNAPAKLGSRCTVFMNSTIINEQRDGKLPEDIMAGLCRSIIENVFTKVVRIGNKDELGKHVVVQGGTFRNRAVLRAIEEYLGMDVKLAPFPGEMGALGAAFGARDQRLQVRLQEGLGSMDSSIDSDTTFIGFDKVREFTYDTRTGVICEGCQNHCSRTIIHFSTGQDFVSGNRCERGAEAETLPAKFSSEATSMDVFRERENMLFKSYDYEPVREDQGEIIGLPRILEFWDSMPFWSTFFKALGYKTVFSHRSSKKIYEQGLKYVASDTICFPAKLAHGHIMDLEQQGVDRIFFPYIMHQPPEGVDQLSPYMCSVLQGYPMVVRNSQNPDARVNYDTPIFHWFGKKDIKKQIVAYAMETLGASKDEAELAFVYGIAALETFRSNLKERGSEVLDYVHESGLYAVVLAGRPYHSDPFICHEMYRRFEAANIPVLPVDALPNLSEQDLSNTKIEITNNFHTRMLEAAMAAAKDPALEYVQIVSFGCGHDAILSDEIIRILDEVGHKSPLVLKVDESQAAGALGIRIQSFLETNAIKRQKHTSFEPDSAIRASLLGNGGSIKGSVGSRKSQNALNPQNLGELSIPSPAKFVRSDKKKRTLLIPNISKEVSMLLTAICEKEGYIVKSLPVGGTHEISLGKKYVHNDICFPAQMVIGELIRALQEGNYNQDEVAVGMVKFQCDCRMSHYAGLLRKGLDKAGFSDVPIVTTDFNDTKKNHPGVHLLGVSAVLEAVWVFMMLDILTEQVRKIRPYEKIPGETNRVYEECVASLCRGLQHGINGAKKAYEESLDRLDAIECDRSVLKPRVFITGELLVTYHPGSNFHIEEYMEKNGMETVFPRVTDQLRKDFRATSVEIKDYNANIFPYSFAVEALFNHVQNSLEKIAVKHQLYKKALPPAELYKGVSDIIPETLSCGEGWLMASEIAHYAEEDVKAFIILQPFGCLPNHVCGRGVIKKLKERYQDISILPLDLDPDTSYANVENRLQMLIMNT